MVRPLLQGIVRRVARALGVLARWRWVGLAVCVAGFLALKHYKPSTWYSGGYIATFRFDPSNPPVALSPTAAGAPGVAFVHWWAGRRFGFLVPYEECWCQLEAPGASGGTLSPQDLDLLRPAIAERARAERWGAIGEERVDVTEQVCAVISTGSSASASFSLAFSGPGIGGGKSTSGPTGQRRVYWQWIGWSVGSWMLVLGAGFFVLLELLTRSVRTYYHSGLETLVKGRCPHCQYDLAGNPAPICPECGTVFEVWRAEALPWVRQAKP